MGLLGHAAADPDDQPRVCFLELFECPNVAENPLFSVFPYGAGIEQDQIGLFDGVAQAKTDVLQNAAQLFAVVDILLAAVAVYEGQRRRIGVKRRDQRGGRGVAGVGACFQNLSSHRGMMGRYGRWADAQKYRDTV